MAFAVVNAGQRNQNVAPELIAVSTLGGFRLTGEATKALGVKPGDYVMFLYDEESSKWAIAKGFLMKKSNGENQKCSARVDKKAAVSNNFDEALAAALGSGNEELISALSVEGITKDEQIIILADAMKSPETDKYQGSKTANPSGFTGEGASVNFTDSNVWAKLKSDMEDASKLNRVFALDINAVMDVVVFDGHDNVTVKAIALGDYEDKTPARIGE